MSDLPTTYNNDRAYQNSWIVYINGLQVPCAGVQVTHGVWQIPEAQIQMVPDPALVRLGAEDRVAVQVFYCDQWYRTPPEFCLLFDGEIVSWSYVGTTGSRAISFVCIDYIQILTQLFFFFMSSFDDIAVGVSGQQLGVGGATVELAGFSGLYPYSLFSQGLADLGDSTQSNATISRPIDFAYNIVRALIKAQHPNRTIPSANFFSPWCKRTNFHRRWIALPYIDMDPGGNPNVGVFPILRAVQADQALAAVARMASTTGTAGSVWDMLRDVLMTMMMEVSMNPAPPAVRSDFASLLPKGPIDGQTGPIFLANYCVKPQFFFGLPPTCNVFFPPQTNSYAYNENYITQPTRMYFNEEAILSLLNANGNGPAQGLGQLMQDALTTAYPDEADSAAREAIEGRSPNGKNLLIFPEEFFKGPVIDRRSMPRWFTYLLEATRTQGNPGATPTTDTGEDAAANNVGDPGVDYQVRDITDTDELFGATDAVLNVRDAAFSQAFGGLRLPAWGQVAQGETRTRLRSVRTRALGSVTPPQVFPVSPAPAAQIAGDGSQGSFFASRASRSTGSPRLHAGIDIMGARGLAIVSATAGKIFRVVRWDRTTDAQGNAVYIRDANGGVHRYMHLDSIASGIANGVSVAAGAVIGTMGNSGDGKLRTHFGVHLHYDVTTSGGYRLNYTQRFRELKAGRAATTPTARQQPAETPPAPSEPASPQGQVREPRGVEIAAGDTTRNLFKLYACYEFFKERYSRRQGSVSGAFNPYPVAGYPCMTFDRRSSGVDTVGYIMSVRHTLSPGGWGTDVAFSHGRTLQEMFSLLQRVSSLEAARLGLQQADISTAIQGRTDIEGGSTASNDTLAGIALPTGSLAMAPPEPLLEIQAVIQNFERADEFYKAIFHQGRAVGADVLTASQALTDGLRTESDVYVPYAAAQEIADAQALGESTEQLVARAQSALADAQAPAREENTSAAQRPARRGVFYYPDVIDMVTDEGTQLAIEIEGTDGLTRARMLRTIEDIRNGVASEEDLLFFYNATGERVVQPAQGQPPTPQLRAFLDGVEYTQRARAAATNVRGDVTIVPRPGARALFSSFSAAMGFVGRPICTLDEYIEFLGEDGVREGRVNPGVASAHRDVQLHPAHFYARIRRYRPGPPGNRPLNNITNTGVSTDAATGAAVPSPEQDAGNDQITSFGAFLASLSPDLDSAMGQALLELTESGALDTITATDLPTLEEELAQAAANRAISPASYNRLRLALQQAQDRLGGTVAPTNATGQAPENTPTVAADTPEGTAATYPVEGIPLSFPDTRANWDAVLERYRSNVLTKLPPNS